MPETGVAKRLPSSNEDSCTRRHSVPRLCEVEVTYVKVKLQHRSALWESWQWKLSASSTRSVMEMSKSPGLFVASTIMKFDDCSPV